MPMVTLSCVITGWGANACTVSRMSTTAVIRSSIGMMMCSPGVSEARYLPHRSTTPTRAWRTIQEAMEQQMRADRAKRATVGAAITRAVTPLISTTSTRVPTSIGS